MELNKRIKETEKRFYNTIGLLKELGEKKYPSLITCIAVLRDERVVSGSDSHALRVWDPITGDCLETWKGYTYSITCMTVLPDGRVVSGSDDRTLRVWDPVTSNCLKTWKGHTDEINCVAVLPDGQVVSGSDDRTLRVWDPATGDCLQTLDEHTDSISCVAVFPDGRVVSGSTDNTLRVWDPTTSDCLQTLEGHTGSISCVAVFPDGRVVSGSMDNTLRVWDPATGDCLQTLEGHTGSISCVATLPDGRVVSGSTDNTLRVWDLATDSRIWKGHTFPISCVAVFPDGRVVSGSLDNTLRIWDSATGECLQTLKGHTGSISYVAVFPDRRVVSGSLDKSIRIWGADIEQGRKEYPDACKLTEKCLAYVHFLYEHQASLFSLFRRIDTDSNEEVEFELSLDDIRPKFREDTQQIAIEPKEKTSYSLLMEFMQLYLSTCRPAYTIDFDWGLSSGEENMLRIFSDFYHIFDWHSDGEHKIYNVESSYQKTQCDTALLFMDEPDLTMHPEWQRRLIAILTFFLPRIYPASCVRDMQLILSTHSPLILGDIPRENITYLLAKEQEKKNAQKAQNQQNQSEKDDHLVVLPPPGETFGQNIHTILKESFFLGKGTVGAFAARKINDLADRLFTLKEQATAHPGEASSVMAQLPEIRQMICLVAPSVLRTQLEILLRDVEDQTKPREKAEMEQLLKAWKALPPDKRRDMLKSMEQEAGSHD